MQKLRDAMKIQAVSILGNIAMARIGLVSGTRPDLAAVKVKLQPENVETGWLPVLTPFAGNGWGLVARLSHNDQVLVLFQEGIRDAGIVIGALFSSVDRPPDEQAPPATADGQFCLQHQSGSVLKFTNDGKVTLSSGSDLDIIVGGALNVTGNVSVTGDVTVSGTITGQTDVKAGGEPVSVVNHKHTLVQPGTGESGPPL